jgi:N utilization substance protein A
MNRELINIIEQMSRERGIPKETILMTLESALLSAVRKKYGLETNVNIKIDSKSGKIVITAFKKVVKEVTEPKEEILLSEAKKIDSSKRTGDEIEARSTNSQTGPVSKGQRG